MRKKTNQTVPSEQEIATLIREFLALKERSRHFSTSLSPEERKKTLKIRTGGEKIVSLMARVAKQQNCEVPGLPVNEMQAWQTLADRVRPLLETVVTIEEVLSDTLLRAQSESWRAATAYYSAFNRFGMADPGVRAALRPAIEFFAARRRKVVPTTLATESAGNGGAGPVTAKLVAV